MTTGPAPALAARVLATSLALVLLAALAPAVARAQAGGVDERVGPGGLTAAVGFGDVVADAPVVPLTVTVTPAAPVRGRLLVAVQGDSGRTLERRDVEVGAGGAKTFRFLVPRGFDERVQLVLDGDDRALTIQPTRPRSSTLVVAALTDGDVEDVLPRGASTPVVQASVETTGIDPAWLDLGADVLAGVGTVVVAQPDLTALSAPRRLALEAAVVRGLQLVVTDVRDVDLGVRVSPILDPTSFAPVPGAWSTSGQDLGVTSPGGDTAKVALVALGRGEVVALSTDLVDRPDLLGAVIRQRDELALVRHRDLANAGQAFLDAVGGGITDLPPIWVLALGMAAYILLVGPVNLLVLRSLRRPELAWVTVPAVTLAVILVATAVSQGRSDTTTRQTMAAWWLDDVGTTTTNVVVHASRRGETTMTLPGGGWAVGSLGFETGTVVERTSDAVTASLQLNARQAGGLHATRELDAPPPLDLEAAIVGGGVRIEVTNTSDVAMTGVEVRTAGVVVSLADVLAPGQTVVDDVALPDELPRVDVLDPFDGGFGGRGLGGDLQAADDGPPTASQLFLDRGLLPALDPLPGVVWVVAGAEADGLGIATATVDGVPTPREDALVAVGVTPSPTDDVTSPFEVPFRVTGTRPGEFGLQPPATIFGNGDLVVAFDLPGEGTITRVRPQLRLGLGPDTCVTLERSGPDFATGEQVCGPDEGIPQECPPDATSCTIEPGFSQFCFDDGTCEARFVEGPEEFSPEARSVERWDPTSRGWVALDSDDIDAAAVDPLGRLLLRFTGGTDVDLRGRGVGAELR